MNKELINKLTLIEKSSLLVGYSNMSTLGIPDKGVKPIEMSDGPSGLRLEKFNDDALNNITNALPATCFPTGVTLASTWNIDLAKKMGTCIGKECVNFGINVLLAPAINIQRNPLCGRNFEYLSEDPLLSGKMGANIVNGVQSQGVGACVKHFACNNNEKYRFIGDSIVDLRALHEIYLKPFEIVIKESDPRAIMTAYNQTNGHFCSENKYLIEEILRKSWGFDGITMTDWGGMVHRDIALNNGLDLEMPGVTPNNIKLIYDGVKNGLIREETVDKTVERLIDLRNRTDIKEKKQCDFENHYQVALDIALEGAVLLKNDNNILPLSKEDKVLVVGGLFDVMRYQGAGSSMLNPIILKDHKKAFEEQNIKYEYVLGYKENEIEPNINLEQEAIDKAKDYETILFYGGLNDYVESEGFDRKNMLLPANQLSLIDKIIKLNKKVIVVLFGGSPVELPFISKVDAVIDMMLPGEAGGEATTKLLFGEVSPSGKLSQSWPIKYIDVPFADKFTSSPYELYKESLFVGYRFYSTLNKEVAFSFGYGLSYSKFEYSNLKLKEENDGIRVTFLIKNIGRVPAKEVSQLYISKPDSNIVRPALELKGFNKVELQPNEEKEVSIFVSFDSLKVYVNDKFVLEGGKYQINIGSSSSNIHLTGSVNLPGEKLESAKYDEIYLNFVKGQNISDADFSRVVNREIPTYIPGKKPYTMETPIGEFNTFFGRIFKNYALNLGKKMYKKALKMEDGPNKERQKKAGLFMYYQMCNNCLRSLSFSSGGILRYGVAKGILELSNGHLFKALKEMRNKYEIKEKK